MSEAKSQSSCHYRDEELRSVLSNIQNAELKELFASLLLHPYCTAEMRSQILSILDGSNES